MGARHLDCQGCFDLVFWGSSLDHRECVHEVARHSAERLAVELVTATFEAGAAALGVERVCDVLVEELCSAWITPRDFTSG
jgi:hypothetical protein